MFHIFLDTWIQLAVFWPIRMWHSEFLCIQFRLSVIQAIHMRHFEFFTYTISVLGHSSHTNAEHVSNAAYTSNAAHASNTTIEPMQMRSYKDVGIRLEFWSLRPMQKQSYKDTGIRLSFNHVTNADAAARRHNYTIMTFRYNHLKMRLWCLAFRSYSHSTIQLCWHGSRMQSCRCHHSEIRLSVMVSCRWGHSEIWLLVMRSWRCDHSEIWLTAIRGYDYAEMRLCWRDFLSFGLRLCVWIWSFYHEQAILNHFDELENL